MAWNDVASKYEAILQVGTGGTTAGAYINGLVVDAVLGALNEAPIATFTQDAATAGDAMTDFGALAGQPVLQDLTQYAAQSSTDAMGQGCGGEEPLHLDTTHQQPIRVQAGVAGDAAKQLHATFFALGQRQLDAATHGHAEPRPRDEE